MSVSSGKIYDCTRVTRWRTKQEGGRRPAQMRGGTSA